LNISVTIWARELRFVAKNLAIHVLLTYIIQIKFAKYRLSTLGRGLREMAHIQSRFWWVWKMMFFWPLTFDLDANRHTDTQTIFFHMTLPTVEGKSSFCICTFFKIQFIFGASNASSVGLKDWWKKKNDDRIK
jgi:hypothetical protein